MLQQALKLGGGAPHFKPFAALHKMQAAQKTQAATEDAGRKDTPLSDLPGISALHHLVPTTTTSTTSSSPKSDKVPCTPPSPLSHFFRLSLAGTLCKYRLDLRLLCACDWCVRACIRDC